MVSFLDRLSGLPVRRAWPGYATAALLELGRLRTETLPLGFSKRKHRVGQVGVMIESDWRVEKRFSIQFASRSSDNQVAKGLASLEGVGLATAELTDLLPELELTFDDGRHLRTFETAPSRYGSGPKWAVLFHDKSLVDLAPVWEEIDVTPCLHFRGGRLRVEYCFDETHVDLRRLRRYRFYSRRK